MDVADQARAHWVLVLEPVTVTISGLPVNEYSTTLTAGWSMIGSVYGESVDADSVFPGFYQLLTWSGTSYVSSPTIDLGVSYRALVLEETPITVP